MSDVKCPLCLQKMNKSQNNMFYCGTDNCSLRYIDMPKKALEEFAESYQNRLTDCKRIGNLNEELTRTCKALKILQEFFTKLYLGGKITDEELERYKKILITSPEQKDIK